MSERHKQPPASPVNIVQHVATMCASLSEMAKNLEESDLTEQDLTIGDERSVQGFVTDDMDPEYVKRLTANSKQSIYDLILETVQAGEAYANAAKDDPDLKLSEKIKLSSEFSKKCIFLRLGLFAAWEQASNKKKAIIDMFLEESLHIADAQIQHHTEAYTKDAAIAPFQYLADMTAELQKTAETTAAYTEKVIANLLPDEDKPIIH